jgi:DNA invertase Pin-like site-specific DNA recombinase
MGLHHTRKQGKQLGRPKVIVDRDTVLELHKAGNSVRTIAQEMGLTKSTVHNIVMAAGK